MKRRLYYYGEDVLSKSFLIIAKGVGIYRKFGKNVSKIKDSVLRASGTAHIVCQK